MVLMVICFCWYCQLDICSTEILKLLRHCYFIKMLFVSCPFLKGKPLRIDSYSVSAYEIKGNVLAAWGFDESDIYLLYNGKPVSDSTILTNGVVHAIPRLVGGKGGFGSMLRAIGAQIEKTTNREACRDLSGRRLRDINEEKRLKNWIAQQAEREQEARERKIRKLERLREELKHNFHDQTYEKERSELTEKISDAVEQGFRVATENNRGTGCSKKRKATDTAMETIKKKKKKEKGCLWLDADEEGLSLSDDSDDSGSDIQPGTSGNGREVMINNRVTCDAVVTPDEFTSSENSKDGESKDATEDSCKIAVEAPRK